MPTTSYAQFSSRLHRAFLQKRAPGMGTVELTRRCNLSCIHCYNNLSAGDAKAHASELTPGEHFRILDEIAEAGCLWLLYTGGEILLRNDFPRLFTHARNNGFLITLFTNGTRITPDIADYLAERRPFAIEIPVYGRTPAVHDRITGVRGSHARCLRGIQLLLERGLPLRLKTTVLTINKHEIPELQRFVREELGVTFRLDAMLNCRLDCGRRPLDVRLTPEETLELDLLDPDRLAAWRRIAAERGHSSIPVVPGDNLYSCGGGLTAFSIDPTGTLSICDLSNRKTFDLRKGPFREGWDRFLLAERRRKTSRTTKCTRCAIKTVCGMCPANAELENADPETPVEYFCRLAHLRAHAFGLPVPPHGDCEYCPGGVDHWNLLQAVERLTSERTESEAIC